VCTGDSYVYWGQLCVLGTAMCTGDSYVYWGQLCVLGTAMCTGDSCVCWGQLCVLGTAMCVGDSYVCWGQLCVSKRCSLFFFIHGTYVRSVRRYCFVRNYAAVPVQLEIVILQYIGWRVLREWTFVFYQFSRFCQFLLLSYYYYYF
jgi:hypothetical protein